MTDDTPHPDDTDDTTGRTDPADTTGRTDPADTTDRTDPADTTDRTDPADTTDRTDPADGDTDPPAAIEAVDTLLIASTAESTGKTAIAVALGLLARERGRRVGYMKPKGTRLQSRVGKTLDTDPMLAREVLDLDAEMHELEPIVYSPTFVEGAVRGTERPEQLHERVRGGFADLAADADLMLVEGGGVHTTGGIVDLTDPDVADLLDARVLLVADYAQPADLDDLLAGVADFGDRLEGVLFNRVADAAYDGLETDAVPFLESRDVPVAGVVPKTKALAGVTVSDLASELGAERLTDVDSAGGRDGARAGATADEDETENGVDSDEEEEVFIERFLVGAMGADAALQFFRRTRDAAVITGGDRADIHTAAIEAPGVQCLILTGGHRPSGAVLGRAEEAGMPVLAVNADTLSTVERAEDVVRGGRTRDEETVRVMRDLLADHVDVGGLVGGD